MATTKKAEARKPAEAVKESERAVEEGTRALVPIQQQAVSIIEKASAVVKIRTDEERKVVNFSLSSNKDLQKVIRNFFKPMKEATDAAHSAVCDQEHEVLDPLVLDEKRCKRILDVDQAEQDRIAEEKRMKLQAEADAKAEKDRKDQLAALKAAGQKEEAAALKAAPVQAAQVVVENKAQMAATAAGLTFKVQKHMQVMDEAAIERQYLSVNQGAIQAAGDAYWQQIRPADPKDAQQFAAAVAKFSAWQGVKGVRFWVTKESADTGRRI